jgi:acetyl esterase/lipase
VTAGRDITAAMDPELGVVWEQQPELESPTVDPAASRRRIAEYLGSRRPPPREDIRRRDVAVGDVPVRVYEPDPRTGTLPAILYIHGGGFIVGALDDFDQMCERLVDAVDAVVASVDYRLAPEHTFPAATDDCYAALRWLFASAGELDVDDTRIAVVGPSAGGGLTAGVALMARDRGEVQLALQMPLCACLDDRHETQSSHEVVDRRGWCREFSLAAWEAYLGPQTGEVSPYAAPARADDLAGLPPTYMMVGELDLMRDENIEYASRLVKAGVPTEFHLVPGAFHGFEAMVPGAAVTRAAVELQERALRRALHPQR